MATIGNVQRKKDGSFDGSLKMLSFQGPISIMPVKKKTSEKAPDYRVLVAGVEVGGAWKKIGQQSGEEYISCSISAPELNNGKTLFFNLGKAADQDDADAFSCIWNGK